MTWQELKEEAKKMGYSLKGSFSYYDCEALCLDGLTFCENGMFFIDGFFGCFSYDRTPDQMLAIMKALQ